MWQIRASSSSLVVRRYRPHITLRSLLKRISKEVCPGFLSDRYYRERVVHVLGNRTLLLRFDYDYEVDLDEINSEADLLHWTLHFCEKVWMTTERLSCFIETVAAIKHLKVDY